MLAKAQKQNRPTCLERPNGAQAKCVGDSHSANAPHRLPLRLRAALDGLCETEDIHNGAAHVFRAVWHGGCSVSNSMKPDFPNKPGDPPTPTPIDPDQSEPPSYDDPPRPSYTDDPPRPSYTDDPPLPSYTDDPPPTPVDSPSGTPPTPPYCPKTASAPPLSGGIGAGQYR